jgi:hypothetical protein
MSGAKVTITDIAKGQVTELATNSSGSFNSGSLKKDPKTLLQLLLEQCT